jgi:hypothetical protein
MSEETVVATSKTPWHIWLVGIITLLWNSMGALDFTMTMTKNEAWMSSFTEEQLDFFYGFPGWLIFFWAIAVWASLLGSLLLLFRSKFAFPVLTASFLSMVVVSIHNFGFSNGLEIMGTGGAIFSGVIFLVALLLVWYSKSMTATGVLR